MNAAQHHTVQFISFCRILICMVNSSIFSAIMKLREMGSKLQPALLSQKRRKLYSNIQYAHSLLVSIPEDVSRKHANTLHSCDSRRPATAIPTIQGSAFDVDHVDAAVNSWPMSSGRPTSALTRTKGMIIYNYLFPHS